MPVSSALPLIRGINPIWSMVDLQGKQLDDTYYLFTLENTIPYIPSNIWQDFNGNTPWSDPIQFLANGTLPNNMYWDPDKIYRLEIRKGNTQNDALIYLVENYVPDSTGGIPSSGTITTENQVTNPQFVQTNITDSYTTANTSFEVAPGWVLSGVGGSGGSITVQRIAIDGNQGITSNPPYALSITSSGYATISLTQTFTQNAALWATVSLALTVVAKSAPAGTILTGTAIDSNNVSTNLLSNTLSGAFNEISGNSAVLPASTDTSTPPAGSLSLALSWPAGSTVSITSIQLVAQDPDLIGTPLPYEQISTERQIDHTFHYWKPYLDIKPIPSYLVGWDFPLNPAQFGETIAHSAFGANKAKYFWDQTIAFQSVDNSIGVARQSLTNGININAAGGSSSFALVQYLDASQAREILSQRNAVKLKAFTSTPATTLTGYVNLYWTTDASLPVLGNGYCLVSSITAGVPAVGGGGNYGNWHKVGRSNLPDAKFTATTTPLEFDFRGFDDTATAGQTTATFFAIVISFDTLAAGNTLTMNYCSLVGGDIPTRPAPLTPNQVLSQCEYYYEKSYSSNTVAGANTLVNSKRVYMNSTLNFSSSHSYAYASPFEIVYRQLKRITPVLKLYTPSGTIDVVLAELYYLFTITQAFTVVPTPVGLSAFWTATVYEKSASFVPYRGVPLIEVPDSSTSGTTKGFIAADINFHYVVDARLGIV